ncbi:hypothetical protein JZ751_024538 [Albula glossodonta]|uniref:Uncharacterized protein n=1 Tax=Albula glossodonta TaxID=121402 RepID=A0A8T2PEL5_9TELE|nr:hypothetical protein JZ751_024538 [Albula glossodonta]
MVTELSCTPEALDRCRERLIARRKLVMAEAVSDPSPGEWVVPTVQQHTEMTDSLTFATGRPVRHQAGFHTAKRLEQGSACRLHFPPGTGH